MTDKQKDLRGVQKTLESKKNKETRVLIKDYCMNTCSSLIFLQEKCSDSYKKR